MIKSHSSAFETKVKCTLAASEFDPLEQEASDSDTSAPPPIDLPEHVKFDSVTPTLKHQHWSLPLPSSHWNWQQSLPQV